MNRQYIKIFSCSAYSPDELDQSVNNFCVNNKIKIISTELTVHDKKVNIMKEYILTMVYEII